MGLRAVIWVSGTECLSPLTSHQPSTPAVSVPLGEQEYNQEELCTLFIHVHVARPFLGNFNSSGFSCLTVNWVGHYLHCLEPGIE